MQNVVSERVRGCVGVVVMTLEKTAAAASLLPDNSVSAIARMVGVSRGTIYSHMDSISAAAKDDREESK